MVAFSVGLLGAGLAGIVGAISSILAAAPAIILASVLTAIVKPYLSPAMIRKSQTVVYGLFGPRRLA